MAIAHETGAPAPGKAKPKKSSAGNSGAPNLGTSKSTPYERNNVTKLTPYSEATGMSEKEIEDSLNAGWAEARTEHYTANPPAAGARAGGPANAVDPDQRGYMGAAVQEAIRAAVRDTAFGTKKKLEKPKTRKSYEMSWDDYMALTDEKRAAVDFNTLLIQAREKDLNTKYKATATEKQNYNDAVMDMFGEDGGSETFAPETLGVLQQIDYKGYEGEDFDDFLSLRSTISEKELTKFAPEKIQPYNDINPVDRLINHPESFVEPETYVGEELAAINTAALQQEMANANQLLQNFHQAFRLDRDLWVDSFGGTTPDKMNYAPGWNPMDFTRNEETGEDERTLDWMFRQTFAGIVDERRDPAEVWAAAADVLTPEEQQQFRDYLDLRTRQMDLYDLQLTDDPDFKLRSPELVRELVGLDLEAGERRGQEG